MDILAEKPHVQFLVDRGYKPLGSSTRKFAKYLVYVGVDKNCKKCIILRRNKKRNAPVNAGKFVRMYDIVYKGGYPFDIPDFATILFNKLKLDYIPTKKKRFDEMIDIANEVSYDEEEDMDTLMNDF